MGNLYLKNLSEEELYSLLEEVKTAISLKESVSAQKRWDEIICLLRSLVDEFGDTDVYGHDTLEELYRGLEERPDWEYNFNA